MSVIECKERSQESAGRDLYRMKRKITSPVIELNYRVLRKELKFRRLQVQTTVSLLSSVHLLVFLDKLAALLATPEVPLAKQGIHHCFFARFLAIFVDPAGG